MLTRPSSRHTAEQERAAAKGARRAGEPGHRVKRDRAPPRAVAEAVQGYRPGGRVRRHRGDLQVEDALTDRVGRDRKELMQRIHRT